MNAAHVHLLVNHVSLFCMIIGMCSLGAAMIRKSSDLRTLAVALFVVGGVFGYLAHMSGDKAFDVVKELNLNSDPIVKEHDEAADFALYSSILVGTLALVMEFLTRKQKKAARALQWIVLILSLHGTTVFLRTAYLGGLIRHTEIRDSK